MRRRRIPPSGIKTVLGRYREKRSKDAVIGMRYDARTDVPRIACGPANALPGGARQVTSGAYAAFDGQNHALRLNISAVRRRPAGRAATVAKAPA